MKTKSVPCIVMLVAGLASCLISISQKVDTMEFTVRLLSTLVIFYIFGLIIKVVLDKAMKKLSSEEETETAEDGESSEQDEAEQSENEEQSGNDNKDEG